MCKIVYITRRYHCPEHSDIFPFILKESVEITSTFCKYAQGVNGAVYLCTKSDGGPLGLKVVAYREQNTLLQYAVFVFMVFLIRAHLSNRKLCRTHTNLAITFALHARTGFGEGQYYVTLSSDSWWH